MDTGNFEQQVIDLAGMEVYTLYQPDLLLMKPQRRQRVLYALQHGLPLPSAIWHVVLSKKLPDLNFTRYMRYVINSL